MTIRNHGIHRGLARKLRVEIRRVRGAVDLGFEGGNVFLGEEFVPVDVAEEFVGFYLFCAVCAETF
jgi:hypothetical protein